MNLRISISILLLFVSFSHIEAQETNTIETSLWEIAIFKNLKYPSAARSSGLSGTFVIELKLSPAGKIDSVLIVHDAKKTFKDASMEAFEKAMDLWSPDLISTKQNTEHYLIAFNFQYLKSGDTNPLVTAQELMSLKKYQKAIKVLDKAIEDKPYDAKLYDLRSKVYLVSGDKERFIVDMEKAQEISNNLISTFDMRAFTVTSVRRVSGSF